MATNDPFRPATTTQATTNGGPVETTVHRETFSAPVQPHTHSLGEAHAVAVPAHATAHPRISWGAIFAGAVMALVAQLAFSLLGLGLGASAANPYADNPVGGLGTGAAIWTLLSVLISLFTGGYVAGRLAGMPRAQDSMLHGLVTFGLTSLLGFYLLTSGVGKLIGGAGSLVSSVVSSAGQAAAGAAPGLVDAAKDKLQDAGFDVSDIQGQLDQLLRQTGKTELQPENLQARGQNAVDQAQGAAGSAVQNPNAAGTDVKGLVSKLFGQNKDVVNAADRDALVNVIMSRTGKTRPEAEQIVNNYQQTYEQTKAKAQQVAAETKEKAKAAADVARKGAAKGGLAASLALVLGALAAAMGGRRATPRGELGVVTPTTLAATPYPH